MDLSEVLKVFEEDYSIKITEIMSEEGLDMVVVALRLYRDDHRWRDSSFNLLCSLATRSILTADQVQEFLKLAYRERDRDYLYKALSFVTHSSYKDTVIKFADYLLEKRNTDLCFIALGGLLMPELDFNISNAFSEKLIVAARKSTREKKWKDQLIEVAEKLKKHTTD